MKSSRHPIFLIVLILAVASVRPAAADEQPRADSEARAAAAMTPIDLREIKIGGEIGRRIDITAYKNLLAIDFEKDFLTPFRQRNLESGYIGLGKSIDAAVRLAAYTNDEKVRSLKRHLVAEVIKTQEPDGYIGILVPKSRLWGMYDIHEMSYLVLGLANDYRYFGEKDSLAAARKLADHIMAGWSAEPSRIPNGSRSGMYGVTTGLDAALLTLYQQTKDRRYLDFIVKFEHLKLPQWNVIIKLTDPRWDDQRHAYVHMCLCVAQLQLYDIEPDPRLLEQAQRAIDFLTQQDGLLVSGSCSLLEGWHDTQAGDGLVSESCATAYLTRMLDRLLRITGDAQFGNMMERAVYNALFAAQSPDGRNIRYFTPLEGKREYFQDTFCCPNNFRRIIAELPGMVCYRSGDGVAINLFAPSTAKFRLAGGRSVTIQQETNYPTSGLVKIAVTPSDATEFPLRLRIPRWCPKATLAIDGLSAREVSPGKKFCEIRRTWKPGDVVTLDMPMPWRLVRGRKLQAGRVAMMRGPVVYCIGVAQNGELLKKYKDPRDLMIDPASLGKPVADASARPDGLKVLAKAWPPGNRGEGLPTLDVVLTEFTDPSCIATYFRVPDAAKTVDDELMSRE